MNEKLDYVQKLETQIATTKDTLEKLKSERDQKMATMQHEEIENLEKYLDQANVDLKGLSASAEDAWQEFKESLENLMSNIRASLSRLLGESSDSSDQ
ncbi:MAG: hypothetical protein AAGF98_16455 [Cyanobacteria bacterium P01_H01_bin.153]